MSEITFKCSICKQKVTEPYNEDIARAELARDYPEDAMTPKKDLALVCDPCYKKIRKKEGMNGDTLH